MIRIGAEMKAEPLGEVIKLIAFAAGEAAQSAGEQREGNQAQRDDAEEKRADEAERRGDDGRGEPTAL